jgi:tRNA nucleotidyltransferase/poly(A) polymerase
MQPLEPDELISELHRYFPELDRLERGVFLVGGALRDLLLAIVPADVDLVCRDARTAATRFARSTAGTFVDLGRDTFPTFRVVVKARVYDFNEMSGSSIQEDLGRRDFTVNAMAFDPHERDAVVDPFDGRGDLRQGVVRMVARENIADDPLRILKGIRTAAAHEFDLEPETARAFREFAPELRRVARERVTSELARMFSSNGAGRALELLRESGADSIVLPAPLSKADVERAERIVAHGDPVVVWALLFRSAPAELDRFALDWRWSEQLRRDVNRLLGLRERVSVPLSRAALLIALYDSGSDTSMRLQSLLAAEGAAGERNAVAEALAASPQLFSIRPALTGTEITALTGMAPGKKLGAIKRLLLEAQIAGDVRTRDDAEKLVRRLAAAD